MAYSSVDICNIALTKLGAQRITSLTDLSKQANECNAIFKYCVESVLAEHPWTFAVQRASLSLLATTPEFGYDNEFQLPSDFLRLLTINEVDIGDVEHAIEGSKLLTDSDAVKIKYIARISDTAKFNQPFVDVLVCRLAVELAYNITHNATLRDGLYAIYLSELDRAKSRDSQSSGRWLKVKDSEWIESRASGTGATSGWNNDEAIV